jgi:hypothetical protein
MEHQFNIKPIFIAVFLVFCSCETEVDLNAEWKEITTVYGLINQLDTDHYFRINKAFLGGNALQIAKIDDSSSYKNDLDVKLEGWGPDGPLYTINFDTITFDNKDSGLWYNPYMVVYKGTGQLIPDLHYRLIIRNKRSGQTIRSKTNLIKNFLINQPTAGGRQSFVRGLSTPLEWNNGINARRYEPVVRFHFLEIPESVDDTIYQHIDYVLSTVTSNNLEGVGAIETVFGNDGFYEFLRRKLDNNFEGKRLCEKVEFIIFAGGDEYDIYKKVNGPSYSLVMDKPEYTNIENGLGLFSSRYSVSRTKRLDAGTEDEIIKLNIKFVKNPKL